MQDTGLKDRNGKEIHEGDIIKLSFEELQLIGYAKQEKSGTWEVYKNEQNHVGLQHNKNRIEIIGNINENPELLENS